MNKNSYHDLWCMLQIHSNRQEKDRFHLLKPKLLPILQQLPVIDTKTHRMNRFVLYMDGNNIALESELWKYGEGGELITTLWIKISLIFCTSEYDPNQWFRVEVVTEPWLQNRLTPEDRYLIEKSFEKDNTGPRRVVFGEKVILID